MQAICNHELRIRWIDVSWPGSTANYMVWVTSDLYNKVEKLLDTEKPIISQGFTLVGDDAYVKSSYMTVPFNGNKTHEQDSYNFNQSQLRITIERTFGVLIHPWSILRCPLLVQLINVAPLVSCLCSLHNYCIGERLGSSNRERVERMTEEDAYYVCDVVHYSNYKDSSSNEQDLDNKVVTFTADSLANDLVGGGKHFNECPPCPVIDNSEYTPMDEMYDSVQLQELVRPT